MIRIEVDSITVTEKRGVSAKSGKPYLLRSQGAFAHTVDANGKSEKYPTKIEVSLEDDQDPYSVGMYTVHPSSLFVGDYNRLSVGRLRLSPQAAAGAVDPQPGRK